jgi:hypothetical protein
MEYLVQLNEKKSFIKNFNELKTYIESLNKDSNFKIIKVYSKFNDIEKDEISYCITMLRYIPSKSILSEAIKIDSSIVVLLSYYGIEN